MLVFQCSTFWAGLSVVLLLSPYAAQQVLQRLMFMFQKRFLEMLKDRVDLKDVVMMGAGKCSSPEIKIIWHLELMGKVY